MPQALDEVSIAAIADALASYVLKPWLTAAQAAVYLRCPESRIRKLVMLDVSPFHKDGRRVLFHRDQLDEYVRRGGAFAA